VGAVSGIKSSVFTKYQDAPDGVCRGEGATRYPHVACVGKNKGDGEEGGQVMKDFAPCLCRSREGWPIKYAACDGNVAVVRMARGRSGVLSVASKGRKGAGIHRHIVMIVIVRSIQKG
jgi:hypothetical protein